MCKCQQNSYMSGDPTQVNALVATGPVPATAENKSGFLAGAYEYFHSGNAQTDAQQGFSIFNMFKTGNAGLSVTDSDGYKYSVDASAKKETTKWAIIGVVVVVVVGVAVYFMNKGK